MTTVTSNAARILERALFALPVRSISKTIDGQPLKKRSTPPMALLLRKKSHARITDNFFVDFPNVQLSSNHLFRRDRSSMKKACTHAMAMKYR